MTKRRLITVGITLVVVSTTLGFGLLYLSPTVPSWGSLESAVTPASEIGIAVFTAIVALVEVTRFLQGPKISVIVKDTLDLKTRTLARKKESYQEYREEMSFEFPVVFANTGARGGAITGVEIELLAPPSRTQTNRDGQISTDIISFSWTMGEVPSMFAADQIFRSERAGVLSIKDNESKALLTTLNFEVRDGDSKARYPAATLSKAPVIRLKLKCTVTSGRKGKEVQLETDFSIKPAVIERIET